HFGGRSVLARPDSRRPPSVAVGRGHQHVPHGERRRRAAATSRRPVPVWRTADRFLQLAHNPVAEDTQIAAPVRFDALLGRQQSGGHPGSSSRGSLADRRDILRCDDFQPDVGCFSTGGAAGSCGPAAAPNTAIPPLRLRTCQLTPLAACCSAMLHSSDCIASIDLSGDGPCEWYSTVSCPANTWVK